MENNWFDVWFSSPYYKVLYRHRDDLEARLFLDNLMGYINLPENGTVLDVACGNGRHAKYLSELGYSVTGIDLSEKQIALAKDSASESLSFDVFDMRNPYPKQFDGVMNLFTSFGYFESDADHLQALKNMHGCVNEWGIGVLDFLNADYVINNLIPVENLTLEGIEFGIKRNYSDGYLYKQITVTDGGKEHNFTERVRAYTLKDFEQMMDSLGIYLLEVFGNYKLQRYVPLQSERLLMLYK